MAWLGGIGCSVCEPRQSRKKELTEALTDSHNDVINCLEYNPVTAVLASCSTVDFGLWSLEQKAVSKYKVPNVINACCWSSDGQSLALAFVSGHISVRARVGALCGERPACISSLLIWSG